MSKTLFNNNINKTNKKISKTFMFEKTLTPIKIISKCKGNNNKERNLNSKITKEKNDKICFKNNKNKIKVKILNYSKNNSRNFSSFNDFNSHNISPMQNYSSFETTNSIISMTTNFKTSFESNITKTPKAKDKISNKRNLSSFIENNTPTFFQISINGSKKEKIKMKNISLIKKRPKIKISTFSNNNFVKNNRIHKHLSYQTNYKKLNKNVINNTNKSFFIPKSKEIMKSLNLNVLTPIRKNTKLKYKNSLSLNKTINRIEKNINIINKKQKTIEKNKKSINKDKLKNLYTLLEKQRESNYNKEKIKKEKNDIEIMNNKLKIIKERTNQINAEIKTLNDILIKRTKESNEIKENIDNALNDKKNVKKLIILLHKRIIDIKKRIKEHDEESYFLDRSFYELNMKYYDNIIINK